MFLQGVVVATLMVLHVAVSAPAKKEKIQPVDLRYYCLHIKQEGKEHNKSPILLIHGLGSSHHDWDGISQVLALQTGRRACAVDLRNHGDSPWNDRTDIVALTADIEHFLDQQKIKKVNIIGHSLGGKIGVHFALNNPDRVDSLVVEDMRPNGITPTALALVKAFTAYLGQAIESVPEGSGEQDAKKSILEFFAKKLAELNSTEVLDERIAKALAIRNVNGKWQWKMNLKLVSGSLENAQRFLTESSGLYKGPTLFIYGTKSVFDVGGDKDNIIELFPNAKLIPIEGAGHVIHIMYRQFEDEVIKLLNKLK